MKANIIKRPLKKIKVENQDAIDIAQVGDWYWIKDDEGENLYCIEHKGSNFFRFKRASSKGWESVFEILFNDFEESCKREDNWKEMIKNRISNIQDQIKKKTQLLIAEGKRLSLIHQPKSENTNNDNFLPTTQVKDPKIYKDALVKFRDDKMPAIQKEIEELSKQFACENKNLALPDLFKLEMIKRSLKSVEDRIFTINLYCGLQETIKQIKDGSPSSIDTPITIRQLVLYMDEETLFDYNKGGMDFTGLDKFDKWAVLPRNLSRLLPEEKGMVALQVRRKDKNYGIPKTFREFLINLQKNMENKKTYLLIRNGEKVYRIASDISFSPRLVPLRNEIGEKQFLTQNDWYKEDFKQEVITPDSIEFDSCVEKQNKLIKHYNKIFIFIQGLLDRSSVFHPHPGIKLNKSKQIELWINCVRDEEDVLPGCNIPNWEEYRDQLNKSVKAGNYVWSNWKPNGIGTYNERTGINYTILEFEIVSRPAICKVLNVKRDKSQVKITWEAKYWRNGRYSRLGNWIGGDYVKRNRHLWVPMKEIFNVSAYLPGDYKIFLCDRNVKGEYWEWANPLLTAEEHYIKSNA